MWGADVGAPNTVAGQCEIVSNGTPVPKTSAAPVRALGHEVDLADQSSGLSAIVRIGPGDSGSGSGWVGGADPRREGLVMGDMT